MRYILTFLCLFTLWLTAEEPLLLRNNLEKAHAGDYIVIAQGKSYTLFHVFDVQPNRLTIEEVTIPSPIACQQVTSWKSWLYNGAPQNTSWVHYQLDLNSGKLENYYSFTKNGWFLVPEADNFLQTLLQLKLQPISDQYRKRVGAIPRPGAQDTRPFWQPNMVMHGQIIEGVNFDAYYAKWPQDGGPLSGKAIEIYLPHDSGTYPGYFPYWLQVKGVIGQAKVRIVDSGTGIQSPKHR